jgi:hypothetical protein
MLRAKTHAGKTNSTHGIRQTDRRSRAPVAKPVTDNHRGASGSRVTIVLVVIVKTAAILIA